MIRTRRSVFLATLICVAAIGTPPGTMAGEPHGRLGVGLRAVASGQVPDRSIVGGFGESVRKIGVSVELDGELGLPFAAACRRPALNCAAHGAARSRATCGHRTSKSSRPWRASAP